MEVTHGQHRTTLAMLGQLGGEVGEHASFELFPTLSGAEPQGAAHEDRCRGEPSRQAVRCTRTSVASDSRARSTATHSASTAHGAELTIGRTRRTAAADYLPRRLGLRRR